MAETYSIGTTGVQAASKFVDKTITLPDSATIAGTQNLAMRNGGLIYCKGPDGAFGWYQIDTERSRAGGTIYLLAQRP